MPDPAQVSPSREDFADRTEPCHGVVLASRTAASGSGYTALVTAEQSCSIYAGTALTGWTGAWWSAGGGATIWIRDLTSRQFWRVGLAGPSRQGRSHGRLTTEPGVAVVTESYGGLRTALATAVLPEAPVELRQLTVTNLDTETRHLDVTTCSEIILHDPRAHTAHPVFSKLFLQTERDVATGALLVRRRPRDPAETWPWLVHACLEAAAESWETDRARFWGRGSPPGRPQALADAQPLSGTCGNVLDPVLSLRRRVSLPPQASATLTFVFGAAADRQAALALLAKAGGPETAAATAFAAARAYVGRELARLGVTFAEYAWAQDLAVAALRGAPELAAPRGVVARAAGDPASLLARLHLLADEPLAVVDARLGTQLLPTMSRAGRIWRALGLPLQLAVINGDGIAPEPGLVPIAAKALTLAQHDLILATARLVVTDRLPALAGAAVPAQAASGPVAASRRNREGAASAQTGLDTSWVRTEDDHGRFAADGREYVLTLRRGTDGRINVPPQPWVNVIANEKVGCIVSETGAGATWAGNSREHRLTPWFNDPVHDPHGDALLVRAAPEGWLSCMPGPLPGDGTYELRHGHGYSRCRYVGDDLVIATRVCVARDDPVRFDLVEVTNTGSRPRRLTLLAYRELVLGGERRDSGRFVCVEPADASGAVFARNRTAGPWADHVTFGAAVTGSAGRIVPPATVAPPPIDFAPAHFAHAVEISLDPGAAASVTFMLGEERSVDRAHGLLARYATPLACEAAWIEACAFWRDGLAAVQIATPSPAIDLMVNGWLAYQTLSCRIHGRTAFYQSGGAFGYRDQLQDALGLLPYWPEQARRQLLLHAAHQFVEGDVLHWWHPPSDRGLRTRFADDLLWLPYLTAQYIAVTGDQAILAESVPYRHARPLQADEDEAYLPTAPAGVSGDLYDHCCRALDRSLTRGAHGLPLFGTGDWNDGMNRVGRGGRGESVWMGFFLVAVCDAFAPLCDARDDRDRATRYRNHRRELIAALNRDGWDGRYYLRGYYDDGTPLGTHRDSECRIDALVQAWSVLSRAAPPERAEQALDAVEQHLISDAEGLIRLLAPPFVDTPHDPGYIKGYVAGVRENGGQYTHAALWVVRAMAEAGRRNRAAELLEMLTPVAHTESPERVARYQVEPYVVAADVYGVAPHVGRGGWTWYTGSSAWLLRVALESILGIRSEAGTTLVVAPCIPDSWPEYRARWRLPGSDTVYEIVVGNPTGCAATVRAASCDGAPVKVAGGACRVPLRKDGDTHRVEVLLGADEIGGA